MSSTERMLPRVWTVTYAGETIPDVEKLCRGVVGEVLKRRQGGWTFAEYDDALTWTLGQVYVLLASDDYRPGGRLAGWLYAELRYDLIDEGRRIFGRNGQHRLASLDEPQPSGDDPAVIDPADPIAGDDRQDQLDGALSRGAVDGPESRVSDLGWVLSGAGRRVLRGVPGLGGRPDTEAPQGAGTATRAGGVAA